MDNDKIEPVEEAAGKDEQEREFSNAELNQATGGAVNQLDTDPGIVIQKAHGADGIFS